MLRLTFLAVHLLFGAIGHELIESGDDYGERDLEDEQRVYSYTVLFNPSDAQGEDRTPINFVPRANGFI